MSSEIKGLLFAVLSAMAYGTLPLFGKRITDAGLSNEVMLFWRFIAAFAILAVFYSKQVFTLKSVDIKKLGVAIVGFIISAFFYFECSTYVGTGLAMTIFFVYPIFLAILNFLLLKERLPVLQKIGMCLAFISLVFLSNFEFDFHGDLFWGFVFGILGALGYAVYIFCTKTTGLNSMTLTSWVCLGSALSFGIHSKINDTLTMIPYPAVLYLPLLAILCTLVPIIFFIKAVRLIGNVKASLLSIAEPATTIILGMIFLAESFTWIQVIGFFFMAISIITIEGEFLIEKIGSYFKKNK